MTSVSAYIRNNHDMIFSKRIKIALNLGCHRKVLETVQNAVDSHRKYIDLCAK